MHGEHAFHALERVVRCGGLLSALDPAIASKHLDPQRREVVLQCVGFNDKNVYERQTPWDQDMVRKYVWDVPAPQWQDWFNGPVQELEPAARERALKTIRRLEQSFLCPVENLRPP